MPLVFDKACAASADERKNAPTCSPDARWAAKRRLLYSVMKPIVSRPAATVSFRSGDIDSHAATSPAGTTVTGVSSRYRPCVPGNGPVCGSYSVEMVSPA